MPKVLRFLWKCFVWFLLSVPVVQAKDIDSMKNILEHKGENVERLEILCAIIEEYQESRPEEEYIEYIEEAYNLSRKLELNYYVIYTTYLRGGYYYLKGDYGKAYEYLDLSNYMVKNAPMDGAMEELQVRIRLAFSAYYYSMNNLPMAVEGILDLQGYIEKHPESKYRLMYMNNLGVIYRTMGEYRKSIEYLKGIFDLENLNPQRRRLTYSHLGSAYMGLEIYDSARYFFCQALEIDTIAGKNYSKAETYALLAKAEDLAGQSKMAKETAFRALDLARKEKMDGLVFKVYNILASVYCNLNRIDSAFFFLNLSLNEKDNPQNLGNVVDAAQLRSKLYFKLADYRLAYLSLQDYIRLKDSLEQSMNVEKSMQILNQNIYETKQKENLLLYQREQMQSKYHQKILFLSMVIILLFLSILTFVLVTRLHRKNRMYKAKEISETNLKRELDKQNRKQTYNLMMQASQKENFVEIIRKLKEINEHLDGEEAKQLSKLGKKIAQMVNNDSWNDFELQFTEVYTGFYENLVKDFPNLSVSEKKLCAFIKLNLSTKEIASILNVDPNTVRVARVRLRKKLGLTNEEQSLSSFLEKY